MPPLTSNITPEETWRKRRRLMVQSMLGPAALALLQLARRVEPVREAIDGNANIRLAALATMVTLVLYSLVFQMRLLKLVLNEQIARSRPGPPRY